MEYTPYTTGSAEGDALILVVMLLMIFGMLAGLEALANAYDWIRSRIRGGRS